MLKKVIILIICAMFAFQYEGMLSANENAEGEKKEVKKEIEKVADVKADDVKKGVEEIPESKNEVAEKTTDVKTEGEKKADIVKEVAQKDTDVIAIVNGEKLLRKDLNRRLQVFKSMNQKITKATESLIVDQLAKKIILKQFIKKQNIEVKDEEIKAEIEKVEYLLKANPNSKGKKLKDILESRGSNMEVLRGEVKATLALSKHLKKSINEGDMEDYFDANKILFNGEKVRVSHVLLDTRNLKTKEEVEEKRLKIEGIKEELDNGADIAELAKKYSDCPSAEKGGDIGYFARRGSVVELFAKAAFALKIGEVSGPIQTQFGYHILKLTDRQKGKDVAYDEVRDMVEFVFMEVKTADLIKSLAVESKIEKLL